MEKLMEDGFSDCKYNVKRVKKSKVIIPDDIKIRMMEKDFALCKKNIDEPLEEKTVFELVSYKVFREFDTNLSIKKLNIKPYMKFINVDKSIHKDNIEDMFIREFLNPGYCIEPTGTSDIFTTVLPVFGTKNTMTGKYFFKNKGKKVIVRPYSDYKIVRPVTTIEDITMYILNVYLKGKTALFNILKNKNVYVVGSSLLSLLTNGSFVPGDVDLYVGRVSLKELRSIAIEIFDRLDYDTMEKKSQYRFIITKKNNYKIELFTCSYDLLCEDIVRSFHLPCIKLFYSFRKRNLYGFPSFMEYMRTGICNDNHIRWFSKKWKPIEIFTRYFKRGVAFSFNESDANIFKKHLKKNNIKFYLEEIDVK